MARKGLVLKSFRVLAVLIAIALCIALSGCALIDDLFGGGAADTSPAPEVTEEVNADALPVYTEPAVESEITNEMVVADEQQWLKQEVRYYEGEEPPAIPKSISMFGKVYSLVKTDEPVLEEGMETERTYYVKVTGTISQEQAAEAEKYGLKITPSYGSSWRQSDSIINYENLPDNDVMRIPKERDGWKLAELSYTVTERDSVGIPKEYTASATYRGSTGGSYLYGYDAAGTYKKLGTGKSEGSYIIVATYSPVSEETPIVPVVITQPEPEESGLSLLQKIVMGIALGAIIAVIAYLVWFFAVKKKRQLGDDEGEDDELLEEYEDEE